MANEFKTKNGLITQTLSVQDASNLRFYNSANTFYTAFKAGSPISNVIWTLPSTDSTGTQALVSNGSGTLSWQTIGSGTGTVTSVSGTGTVSGISLSGTVTSSGSLTLGGTLDLSSPPAIGGTAAAAGTFTQLTVNGANVNTSISPTGTGTVAISPAGALTINPTAASTINNTSIGATTASTGRFTTVTSTIATGTAPFTVTSTTNVANLNASSLSGATFASPGTIGGTAASPATFTQLTVNGSNLNTAISPTGTGTVTISPAGTLTLGTAGASTSILGNISATTSNQTVTLSPTGTGTVAISPVGALTINPTAASTINNTSIGATTASTGTFTSLTANGTTNTAAIITPTTALSSTAWTTTGINTRIQARTYTDTSSFFSVAASYINALAAPTFASTNTITIADAANLFVDAPAAGTRSTLTNAWAIYAGGRIRATDFTGTIGATTTSTGAFTTLSASSTVSGTGFSTYLASPPAIGGTAAAAGSFTTLGATGNITATGTNQSINLSPTGTGVITISSGNTGSIDDMNIGATTAGTGAFTTLSASSTVSGTGFSTYLASPPAIGGTTASTGRFTTLTITSANNLQFNNSANTFSTILKAGANTANATFILPIADGTTGQFLKTDGSGNLSFATGSGTVTSVGGTGTVNGLTLTGTVTTTGNLTLGGTLDLSSPPAIGGTAASTGAFTTLSASSTVSGTGFSTYLASPPAIGGTSAAAGSFTTLSASTSVSGVLARTARTTGTTATLSNSTTLVTGGVTLTSQTPAAGSTWRIRAYGTYGAASSGSTRQFTMSPYWGTTQLTAITTGNILTNTAQTTPWQVEFEIVTTSTTAAWVTGILSHQVTSATTPTSTIATAGSTSISGTQTIDFRLAMATSSTAADSIVVHQVTIERIL